LFFFTFLGDLLPEVYEIFGWFAQTFFVFDLFVGFAYFVLHVGELWEVVGLGRFGG
jgi:hypothetical protein